MIFNQLLSQPSLLYLHSVLELFRFCIQSNTRSNPSNHWDHCQICKSFSFVGALWNRKKYIITVMSYQCFNSLAPGKFEWNFRFVIFIRILVIAGWGIYCWLRNLLWNCPNINVTGLNWWSVNISSGNGLVPSGNKPLPELMMTMLTEANMRHSASVS